MKTRQTRQKLESVLVLLLFAVFAVCILWVLLLGGDAYRRISLRDQNSYDFRTASQYLTTRLRQSDALGQASVEPFGSADALVFTQTIEGKTYETLVYCCDGYLRELFTANRADFQPEDGEKVLEAQSLSLRLDGRTLTAEIVTPDGRPQRLTLQLRSGGEAAS